MEWESPEQFIDALLQRQYQPFLITIESFWNNREIISHRIISASDTIKSSDRLFGSLIKTHTHTNLQFAAIHFGDPVKSVSLQGTNEEADAKTNAGANAKAKCAL